jgi:hypothetical protein
MGHAMISEITPAKRTAREPVAGEQSAWCAITGVNAISFSCSGSRRVFGVAVLLWAAVLIPSTSASQSIVQPNLPASGGDAGAALRSLLEDYYQTWQVRAPDSPLGFCDADHRQDCTGRDVDGGCRGNRCHSEEDMIDLVNGLAVLAQANPLSPVPLAHAVYAAVKFGYFDRADVFVTRCAGHGRLPGWCELATGYLLQRSNRSSEVDAHFHRALQALPDSVRCGLEDVFVLLPRYLREEYRRIPCDARADAHRWFWWAADPFLAVEGNDRFAEHLARGFEALVQDDLVRRVDAPSRLYRNRYCAHIRRSFSDSYHAAAWDSELKQWTRRSEWWTSFGATFNHFVPESLSIDRLTGDLAYEILAGREVYWSHPRGRSGAFQEEGHEGYTRAAGFVYPLRAQIARFREKSDSLVVALASAIDRAPPEQPPGAAPIAADGEVWFVASEGPDHVRTLGPTPLRERVAFAARVANRRQVVGVEVFTAGADARERRVIEPLEADARALSDVLLFAPTGEELPETRQQAVALMYGSLDVPRGRPLGLYWEVYGLASGESVRVSVRLRGESGWITGVLRTLGVVGEGAPRAVTWSETVPADAVGSFAQAVALDVAEADAGEYELEVEIMGADGSPLVRSLTFEIVERDGDGRDR